MKKEGHKQKNNTCTVHINFEQILVHAYIMNFRKKIINTECIKENKYWQVSTGNLQK